MSQYRITGQTPLQGSIKPVGNKNAILPMIAACLLTDDPIHLRNVPNIGDVDTMLNLLQHLGASVIRDPQNHQLEICCRSAENHPLPVDEVDRMRSSIYFLSVLAIRFGSVNMPSPGGCSIGRRQIDTHLLLLQKLGFVATLSDRIVLKNNGLQHNFIWSDEMSVSATANFMLAAVLTPGTSTLYNAASEPHIQDLGEMLCSMGAQITGLGTNRIEITGVKSLHGCHHSVKPDYIQVGSFLAAAAATNGSLLVESADARQFHQIIYQWSKLGIHIEIKDNDLFIGHDQEKVIKRTRSQRMPSIECLPWPGFPADLLSITLVMATQCEGQILIHDKMFESRLFFIDKIIRMGGDIFLSDPHRAIVFGPTHLKGKFIESPDLRAGMALVIAALCAQGTSTIDNTQFIERGYESLVEQLVALGARMERVSDHEAE